MASPFDLHVLSTPPAFILSQDQTLEYNMISSETKFARFRLRETRYISSSTYCLISGFRTSLASSNPSYCSLVCICSILSELILGKLHMQLTKLTAKQFTFLLGIFSGLHCCLFVKVLMSHSFEKCQRATFI